MKEVFVGIGKAVLFIVVLWMTSWILNGFNALSDDMKAQVSNYDVLCNAEATYAAIMAQAQAQADAQAAADAAAAAEAAATNGQE